MSFTKNIYFDKETFLKLDLEQEDNNLNVSDFFKFCINDKKILKKYYDCQKRKGKEDKTRKKITKK